MNDSRLGKITQSGFRALEKKLLDSSKSNKLAGDKVTLTYDKIKINSTVYIWNEAINYKVPTPEEARNPSAGPSPTQVNRVYELRLLNLNARSIVNKNDKLETAVLYTQPDIIAMTETWPSDSILDCEITPPNYTILRKGRGSRGGRVAILAKNSIICTPYRTAQKLSACVVKLLIKMPATIYLLS